MTLTTILNIAVIVALIMGAIGRIAVLYSYKVYPSKVGFYVNRYGTIIYCFHVLLSPTQPPYFEVAVLFLTLVHIAISIREDKKILERGAL